MAEQKGERITLSIDELKAVIEAGRVPIPAQVDPTSLTTSFQTANRLREDAEKQVRPASFIAFQCNSGAVAIAYVMQSRGFERGRVLKFDFYEEPPGVMVPVSAGGLRPSSLPDKDFKQWKYKTFLYADINSHVSRDAKTLPGQRPPRATLEEAMLDLDEIRAARDAETARQVALRDPSRPLSDVAFPENVKRA